MRSKKRILALVAAVAAITLSSAMFAAFEAHVINVTAHIENALEANTEAIDFGTVFPQELLERPFAISLSESFLGADRADDVSYVIKQKIKPCPLAVDASGVPLVPPTPIDPSCVADTADATPENPTGFHYLNLCSFLSKNNTETDGTVTQNDTSHPSYYVDNPPAGPSANDLCQAPGPDATGVLAKSIGDTSDTWTLDLKVPPVEGFVGQDWPVSCMASQFFVKDNDKTYGCDLWIEATNISPASL